MVLVFVAMRRNLGELDALVELAAELGVDEVWVQNLSHVFSDTDPAGRYAAIRRYAEAEALFAAERGRAGARVSFGAAAARARALGCSCACPSAGDRRGGRCSWPWDGAYVTHRGNVQPCCMVMGSERATLGRLGRRILPGDLGRRALPRPSATRCCSEAPPDVCAGCSEYRGVF